MPGKHPKATKTETLTVENELSTCSCVCELAGRAGGITAGGTTVGDKPSLSETKCTGIDHSDTLWLRFFDTPNLVCTSRLWTHRQTLSAPKSCNARRHDSRCRSQSLGWSTSPRSCNREEHSSQCGSLSPGWPSSPKSGNLQRHNPQCASLSSG